MAGGPALPPWMTFASNPFRGMVVTEASYDRLKLVAGASRGNAANLRREGGGSGERSGSLEVTAYGPKLAVSLTNPSCFTNIVLAW